MSRAFTVTVDRAAVVLGARFGAMSAEHPDPCERLRRTGRTLGRLGGNARLQRFIEALLDARDTCAPLCCAEQLADVGWDDTPEHLIPEYRRDRAFQLVLAELLENMGTPEASTKAAEARARARDCADAIDVLRGRLRLNYRGEWTRIPWDP